VPGHPAWARLRPFPATSTAVTALGPPCPCGGATAPGQGPVQVRLDLGCCGLRLGVPWARPSPGVRPAPRLSLGLRREAPMPSLAGLGAPPPPPRSPLRPSACAAPGALASQAGVGERQVPGRREWLPPARGALRGLRVGGAPVRWRRRPAWGSGRCRVGVSGCLRLVMPSVALGRCRPSVPASQARVGGSRCRGWRGSLLVAGDARRGFRAGGAPARRCRRPARAAAYVTVALSHHAGPLASVRRQAPAVPPVGGPKTLHLGYALGVYAVCIVAA
jgi:hypothetical protein